ncbi:diphosphomevalonate decarboxylase [Patescibacteria group bacterium]|nr:diphosphomevalonate decarboxylase [Patescibacteria group bacterium]MBU2259073.1 diphosphomevalonate decarboxylase [Patescibacteria group bacterium]
MVTAISAPNIAFIKYWGNRDNDLRLPQADSLSMTLNTPTVEIDIDHSEALSVQSFEPNGSEKELGEKHIQRFRKHLELTKHYLNKLGVNDALPKEVSITVRSGIPSGIGLASSAAVFSCLARAYQGLISETIELNDEQTSVIARLGSGSASRSIFGGFSALVAGKGNDIDSSSSIQIADENHWTLHDIVLAPSMHEKKVGSTEGHTVAQTSPHFADRIEAITNRRQQECIDAIQTKNFEKLQHVSEEDCMDMHHVMETSTPPLQYLNDATHHIIAAITDLRTNQHIPVLYTMDAGPTVHLVCEEEARDRVVDFAHAQADCTVFETKVGKGAHLL